MRLEFVYFSMYGNGAEDPSRWRPASDNRAEHRTPAEGDLVAWRYGAWRVQSVRPIPDYDLTEDELARLDMAAVGYKPSRQAQQREINRPWHLVLRHESGPLLIERDWPAKRLHDGTTEISFRVRSAMPGVVLPEPYMACSCHGHIWPCQEIDQMQMAAHAGRNMDRALATTAPGVCAGCLEPITTRQKTLTFPEESRLVPGAPGPTFHAGRAECWAAAEKYERTGRLVDNPDVVRLASCPGIRFVHDARDWPAEKRAECTAGTLCSGQHGPAGYHMPARACWHRIAFAELGGVTPYVCPPTDCGYRSGANVCLGSIIDGSSAADAVAGDEMWNRYYSRGS